MTHLKQLVAYLRHHHLRPLRHLAKDQKGVALLIALFAMMMMMVIAVEVTLDTTVDYTTSSQAVNRLRAYYAARGGMELSLLRVKLYRKLASQMSGQQQGGGMIPMQLLDQIWQIPFMWPFPVPEEMPGAEKEQLKKTVEQSKMDAQYTTRIESESNKIDINDLGSPSEGLAEATREQILKIFNSQMENDEKFAQRYRGFDFGKLVNNIADWIDEDSQSRNGGDEASQYTNNDGQNRFIPPNQPIKTLDELHMIPLMNDELFDLLATRVTPFGSKGINVNYASRELLMSLDPKINEQVITELLKYRSEIGPFRNKEDFFAFLKNQGVNVANLEGENAVPLFFDAESNFRITSTGTYGKVSREIVAITYDFDTVKQRLVDALKADGKKKQTAQQTPTPSPTAQPTPAPSPSPAPANTAANQTASKGRPNIVYWHED